MNMKNESKLVLVLKRLTLFLFVLIVWKISSLYVNNVFVPLPEKVLKNFIIGISNKTLIVATVYSLRRILYGTLLASLFSCFCALLIYNIRYLFDIFYPIVAIMRYLPVTAFYPLLIMWFGIGETMKVVFLFIASFVYMMPSVLLCLDEIDPEYIDVGKTMIIHRYQMITSVQLPLALPSILNSLIIMIGIGFSYIAVCETVNAKFGLGWIIQQNSSRGRTDMVFMAIIVIAVLSVICDNLGKRLVKKLYE